MNAKIFVVDDEPHIRKLIVFKLGKEGFELLEAASVAEARSQIAIHTDFKLALLDFMLPDGDGLDVVREIRSIEGGKNIPIILLSARSGIEIVPKDGLVGFLPKPFDLDELVQRVRDSV